MAFIVFKSQIKDKYEEFKKLEGPKIFMNVIIVSIFFLFITSIAIQCETLSVYKNKRDRMADNEETINQLMLEEIRALRKDFQDSGITMSGVLNEFVRGFSN